jgi:CRP-like cAMP-binding protein
MSDNTHYSDTFPRSDLFAGIAVEKQTDILSRGHRIVFKSGETLFREGDSALRCYFVLKGRLKMSKLHEQGKEAIIRYINSGELVAAIAVFKGTDYPLTAEAIGAAEVVGWGKETMLKLMLEYAPLAVNMLQAVIDRIDELQTRYLELFAEQVEQRVARALLRIMKQSGRKTNDGVLIDFRLSRQELADYTGTTLYTVSRTLSSWEKSGWIKSGRERITVTDPHALVTFAEKG